MAEGRELWVWAEGFESVFGGFGWRRRLPDVLRRLVPSNFEATSGLGLGVDGAGGGRLVTATAPGHDDESDEWDAEDAHSDSAAFALVIRYASMMESP